MSKEINSLLAQAAQARKVNWIKALNILQDGLQEFSDSPLLLQAIGDLYLSKNISKKAIQFYRNAQDLQPGEENNLNKLATLHMMEFNFAAAKKCLEQINKPSSSSIFKKAICCIHLQLIDEAVAHLESIIDNSENSEAVLFLLSEQYITKKDFSKAEKLLVSLRKKLPKNNKVTFLWGYFLFRQSKWLAAYDYLLRAKRQGFAYFSNIKILALAAYKIGLYSQAIEYFRKSLRFSPFDASIFEYLIKIYIKLEQQDKAKIIAKKIPVFVPKSKKLLDLIEKINL